MEFANENERRIYDAMDKELKQKENELRVVKNELEKQRDISMRLMEVLAIIMGVKE